MSNESTEPEPTPTEGELEPTDTDAETEAGLLDKAKGMATQAKDKAAEIDVKEVAGKAKGMATQAKDKAAEIDVKEVAGKAKGMATQAKDKVTGFVGEHEHQIGSAIEKTGRFVDDKVTRHKFSEHIDKAQGAAKKAVNKVGSTADGADTESPEKKEESAS